MMRAKLFLFAMVAVSALFLFACSGGGGDTIVTVTPTPTASPTPTPEPTPFPPPADHPEYGTGVGTGHDAAGRMFSVWVRETLDSNEAPIHRLSILWAGDNQAIERGDNIPERSKRQFFVTDCDKDGAGYDIIIFTEFPDEDLNPTVTVYHTEFFQPNPVFTGSIESFFYDPYSAESVHRFAECIRP